MKIRVLDLDGSICRQKTFIAAHAPLITPLQDWGPAIRMACTHQRFHRFERVLAERLGRIEDVDPTITLYGSGDFHHVSLAIIRRLPMPINLLVVDNHPDWMRGVPFLHCGTWLYHAARLPWVERVFHIGGDVDFDNYYRPLAPWPLLRSGKIIVFPARRRYSKGGWPQIPHLSLRQEPGTPATAKRIARLLATHGAELAARPLYISIDKDVMNPRDAIVNWDSGHLSCAEVKNVLRQACALAQGRLAGLDTTGDWSPVILSGLLGKLMHWTEHPQLAVQPSEADHCNGSANASLLEAFLPLAQTA
jgi:hypothetical protein